MAVLAGRNADIYLATGTGTAMTGEATTSLGGNVYQITDTAKRAINPNASLTVLDGATPISSSRYQVAYGSGKIYLAAAPAGTITVTGEYLTLSKAAQAYEWSLGVQPVLEEVQVFGDAWKARACVQRDATLTFSRFYNDQYFHTNIGSYYVIRLYADYSGGVQWMAGAQMTSMGVNVGENETIKENVSFATHGVVDYLNS